MSKKARSARGDLVDFDLLAIKQQLATLPVPVGVNQRRKFIDEKNGIKTRSVAEVPSALSLSVAGAEEAANAMIEPVVEAMPPSTKSIKK